MIVESHKVFDIDAKFIKEAITVVDSDKNDIGEVTFLIKHYMYAGAIVPNQLKLITFTDESKYEMEGTISSKILNYKDSIDNNNFTNAPAPILAQAKQIWEKFWEEKQ